MANGLVIHISAGDDRHTEALSQDTILIGTDEDSHIRLRASHLPNDYAPNGTVLELMRGNNSFRVKHFDQNLNIAHNDEPLEMGARIIDGDFLRFADSGLSLQFFLVRSLPMVMGGGQSQVAPFIENAAIESVATARRDDAKVFLREFTRELIREISPLTKIISLLLVTFLISGILYIGFALYTEVRRTRQANEEQKTLITQLQKQLDETQKKIQEANEKNIEVQSALSLVPRLIEKYAKGVCLISGSYYFVESGTGRPLRYAETQYNENGEIIQNGEDAIPMTAGGNGAIAEYEFVGTGFYVGNGYLLTNKHVAQPWLGDENVTQMAKLVKGVPRLKQLYAYFPGRAEPVTIKFKVSAQQDDIAVCYVDDITKLEGVPALPLSQADIASISGRNVVLIGYPNGPDRILAMRDDDEAKVIRSRCGASLETLLHCLSTKNRIQPLTTPGIVTDLDPRRIAHSAETAQGGSGAPLFGQTEEVIGISFAIFTENKASNFAVPIRFAITLLQKAGWKPPSADNNSQEATASNQNKGVTTTTN